MTQRDQFSQPLTLSGFSISSSTTLQCSVFKHPRPLRSGLRFQPPLHSLLWVQFSQQFSLPTHYVYIPLRFGFSLQKPCPLRSGYSLQTPSPSPLRVQFSQNIFLSPLGSVFKDTRPRHSGFSFHYIPLSEFSFHKISLSSLWVQISQHLAISALGSVVTPPHTLRIQFPHPLISGFSFSLWMGYKD